MKPPALRRLLIPLMTSTFSVIMTLAMFAVAVPFIRTEYALAADTASWLIVAYNLPFMALMPLYGRFGDSQGKRNLLIFGLGLFLGGTVLLLTARSLPAILIARAVQGAGSAGVNPLAMAVIVEYAGPTERGKALGTWNSIGPVSGILGPLLAGPLIDSAGWRFILIPSIAAGIIAVVLVRLLIPAGPGTHVSAGDLSSGADHPVPGKSAPQFSETKSPRKSAARSFDWTGVVLFNLMISFIVFFTSSRPITGAEPLTDLRLLAGAAVFLGAFIFHAKRRTNPFIDLSLFKNRNLTRASISVSIRMLLMGGVHFAVPLMVTDLYGFSASGTGMVLVVHSLALLITMQLGGFIIDRWKSRNQIIGGLLVESVAMLAFVLMPQGATVRLIFFLIAVHGLGAGFCLAALHIYALSSVPRETSATAAGIYSMIRFAGSLFGAALGGIILEAGFGRSGISMAAYSPVFLFFFVISLLGALSAAGLSKRLPSG